MKRTKVGRREFIQGSLATTAAVLVSSCSSSSRQGDDSRSTALTDAGLKQLSRQAAYEKLMDYMQTLDIIDAHEHLPIESERIGQEVDVFTLLGLYEYVDMVSAGYRGPAGKPSPGYNHALDFSVPLETRWKNLWPYLQNIKYGSYYRAPKIALRDLYGISDLNENNYRQASEKIKAANRPGLYKSILRDRCKIKTCLVQNGRIADQNPADLLTPVTTCTHTASSLWTVDPVRDIERRHSCQVEDLDAYLRLVAEEMETDQRRGAVGCKVFISPQEPLNWKAAHQDFKTLLTGAPSSTALRNAVLDSILQKAGQMNWPVAVHTGVWGDFRQLDPKPMIDLVLRYPGVQFDIYHLGMPYVRECIFIGKNFPNAHLNLCWAYILSQSISEQSINEIIDTVPINKVFGFGADYIWAVENVYGHLQMARQSLAEALSGRIEKGWIDMDGAKHILKCWLYENPSKFYKIG